MKTLTNGRTLAIVLGGMIGALGAASVAQAEHNSKISCYAYVHDQCFGGGASNCSDDDYDWGLDQCDGYYPSTEPARQAIGNIKASTTDNPRIRAVIGQSMRK
ncbi:hypothetical protein [Roseitalea porphyridii]|uniref:Uncharacterized protein n=1 Tax=Roseitalea porphyridii TaxID=1852022 RepID=A0A4P6V2R3_9HYPH|nr:hypothetical protein [Roseitalea porphyridii]QBK30979.1 hypothetical protein E0E05_10475 [Roseitalea porphyridii]